MSSRLRSLALRLFAALVAPIAVTQELEISVSPQPVGSGARAAGMADAFVAIADDATAASWNPAGLVQLERPEISMVASYNGILERLHAPFHDELSGRHDDHNIDLNYFSIVYPLPFSLLGRNATVAFNYQRKYDFSRAFDTGFNRSTVNAQGAVTSVFGDLDFEQRGGLGTLTPAFAVELTKRLSIGIAFNIWRSSPMAQNEWEQQTRQRSISFTGSRTVLNLGNRKDEYEDFTAENVTLGALWNPTYKWSIGLRYDTAFTGSVDFVTSGSVIQLTLPRLGEPLSSNPLAYLFVGPQRTQQSREVRFPASLAVGVAYRASDRTTVSMDLTRTEWDDFYVKIAPGNRRSLVDFRNLEDLLGHTDFKPTTTVRFGIEHVLVPRQPEQTLNRLWTLRAGFFYDEEPATGLRTGFRWPWDFGEGKPDAFYGAAAGVGLLVNQRINFDVAYQLRYGNNVNEDFLRGVPGFSEDVVQHRVLLSTVIYF